MNLKENFSVVYHRLLDELLQVEVPEENWIDCNNCHLCSNKNLLRFHTKCCDYQPALPNHIVGAILADGSTENVMGRKLILEKINEKKGVTPFGILPDTNYQKNLS